MGKAVVVLGDHTFKIEQSVIEATTMLKPDIHWRFIDPHGHEHKWVGGVVPTIKEVHTGEYYCADCEEMHDESEWQCVECGSKVSPGFTPNYDKQYVPGLKRAFVDDQPVSIEEFKAKWVEYGGDPKHIESL